MYTIGLLLLLCDNNDNNNDNNNEGADDLALAKFFYDEKIDVDEALEAQKKAEIKRDNYDASLKTD